jgi:hypothetical protein
MFMRIEKTQVAHGYQLLLHWLMMAPVACTVGIVIPRTVRKLSLLTGVLHLHEDAVSTVTAHMEMLGNIRNRITSRLRVVKLVHQKANPEKGQSHLDAAINGELEILKRLTQLNVSDPNARINRVDMLSMLHNTTTRTKDEYLAKFLSRQEYSKFLMASPIAQKTAQTAHTLQLGKDPDGADDTVRDLLKTVLTTPVYLTPLPVQITMEEFSRFLLRAVAYAATKAERNHCPATRVQAFVDKVASLASVSAQGLEAAFALARTKLLFRHMDRE